VFKIVVVSSEAGDLLVAVLLVQTPLNLKYSTGH
jgi:hypothetical protein